MKNSLVIKKMVGISVLTALVIVLQLISNYITIGTVNITLALIPIAMGAVLYGPLAGFFLGVVMGVMVLIAPSTAIFFSTNAIVTIFLCPLKTGIAGLVAGLIFRLFAYLAKNKEKKKGYYYVGIILAALVVPIINTGLFIIASSIFFKPLFGDFITIINAVITTNFLIEFIVSSVLSPTLNSLVKILTRRTNLGFSSDFSCFNEDLVIDSDLNE